MVITPIHGFTPGFTPAVDSTIFQGSLDLSLLLYDGKARRSSVTQSEAQVEAAVHTVSDARQEVVARTLRLYLQMLGGGESLRAHDLRLEALRSEATRVEDYFSVGRVAEVEVLRIAAAVADAEAERVLLAADQESAERDMARWLGLTAERVSSDALQRVALNDRSLPSRQSLLDAASKANLGLRQARARVMASQAEIGIARALKKPTLAAVANVTDFGSSQGDFTSEWWVGFRLAVPLYTGGRSALKIGGAEAAHDEAVQRLREAEQRLAESVDHAIAACRATLARETSLGAAVKGFAAVAESERLRLENGVGIPADFLDAEADLLNAKAHLALARNATLLARIELARILGQLDSAWVAKALRRADPEEAEGATL